jgi:hypothetical protein
MEPVDSDAISDSERKKRLTEIDKQREALKAELSECSPAEDFEFHNGSVSGDRVQRLIEYWTEVQRWTSDEVNPRGLSLDYSSEEERRAYFRLKLNEIPRARSLKYRVARPK